MPFLVSPERWEQLLAAARGGRLTRRAALKRAVALGLSAPAVAALLAACGGSDKATATTASAPTATTAAAGGTPTGAPSALTSVIGVSSPAPLEPTPSVANSATASNTAPTPTTAQQASGPAGGGGHLRILQYQAPTILNPHLSTGYKDYDAARIVYEPLADFDADGNPILALATEFPTLDNGGVSQDGTSVTWKLQPNVTWQDGQPFTANDVVFTWKYASDPDTAAVTAASYKAIQSAEAVDEHTVKLTFAQPNPAGFEIFTGRNGMILPEHIFKDSLGANAKNAPANLAPVGTGPYKVTDFRPGDVVNYEINANYWDAGKPYFDTIELKGGGDSLAASQAVLQTGEADMAWGAGGDPKVLAEMEKDAKGVIVHVAPVGGERLAVNHADPNSDVDGAKSEPTTKHPIFQYLEARQAIAFAIPRDVLATEIAGGDGHPETNTLVAPGKFVSKNTTWKHDIDEAKALLQKVGVSGGHLLYQTSVLATRQKAQEVIKAELVKLGFDVELKSVDSAAFFSSDPGNPDTYTHFYADLEMFTFVEDSLYPINYMRRYRSDAVAQKSNNWSGPNVTRYQNPEFDKLHDQAQSELDPDKQAQLFVAMNDMAVNDVTEIPLYSGGAGGNAFANDLTGYVATPWTGVYYDIKNWRKKS